MEFSFDLSGQDLSFKAGQHADFILSDPPYTDEKGGQRIFSFVTSPNNREELAVATRLTGSAFKRSLAEVPLGTTVTVKDIRGQMTLHRDAAKAAVFLAGGIGITPFMSMSRYAAEEGLAHRIYLLYANRAPESTAFLPELEELAIRNPNFTLVPVMSDPPADWPGERGYVSAETVRKHVPEPQNTFFYMAGPPAMVAAMTAVLDELDIADEYRKAEDFAGY